jgi:Leucine-rich repeat (LRR) protein
MNKEMKIEQENLFSLIESWEAANVKIALEIIKKNASLKAAVEERYMPLLHFVGAKSLASLKSLPKKLSTPKFLATQWFPDVHSKAVLKTIPIDEITLGNKSLTVFPEWLCYLSKLRILDVRNSDSWRAKNKNKIDAIPEAIEHLENLEELYISRVELKLVPETLITLSQLRVLDLHYNKIEKLPNLSPLKNLEILHLFINQLSEIEGIENLHQLGFLNVGANELTTITNKIGTLEKLQVLNLCTNKIKALPDSLCDLKNLEKLDIYSLPLDGQLPKDFSKLSYLPWLRLDNIGLSSLPACLKYFTNLQSFRCKYEGKYCELTNKPAEIQAFLTENLER